MSKNKPQFTSFDTTETYLYKLVKYWNVSSNYIIVGGSVISNTPSYLNIIDFVERSIQEKTNLVDIANHLATFGNRNYDQEVREIAIVKTIDNNNIKLDSIGINKGELIGPNAQLVKDFLITINEFRRHTLNQPITLKLLKTNYETTKQKIKETLASDLKIADNIITTHNVYEKGMKNVPFKTTEISILGETVQYIAKADANPEEIDSLFDKIELFSQCKHVVCYGTNKVQSKIYKPDPLETPIENKELVAQDNERDIVNTIFFTCSLSKVYQLRYNISEGYIHASVLNVDREAMDNCIQRLFPTLNIIARVAGIETSLRLYPVIPTSFSMQYHYLLHYTTTKPNIYQFFLNESTHPYPYKNNYSFRYRPSFINESMKFKPVTGIKEESKFRMEVVKAFEGNYINMTIDAVSLVSVYRLLASVIPTLCIYYNENIIGESPLAKLYDIPNLNVTIEGKVDIKKKLKDDWPNIFTDEYLDKVEKKQLVITTSSKKKADEWKTERIKITNVKQIDRIVLPFPKKKHGSTLFYFTSSMKSAAYPNYLDYPDSKYGYLPASFGSVSGKTKAKSVSSAYTILKEGDQVVLSESLNVLVGSSLLRQGVKEGPNSLIDAINTATDKYDISPERIRLKLLNLQSEVFKQQLYDLTYDRIKEKIKNVNEYIDSSLFIAGLEALFNIDIYVIIPSTVKNITTHVIEVPRYKYFYSKTSDPRRCVVLYKNANSKYPHYELTLLNSDYSDSEEEYIYDKESSVRIRELMISCSEQYLIKGTNIFQTNYIYTEPSYMSKFKLDSQYIDPTGKARAFNITNGPTLFCMPSEPKNLSSSREIFDCTVSWLEENIPNKKYLGKSDLGVWFSVGDEVLYVRLKDKELSLLNLELIGNDPFFVKTKSTSLIDNVSKLDKLTLILNSVYKWLYDVYYLTMENPTSKDFINTYFTYVNGTDDDYYNVQNVKEKFPNVTSLKEAFDYAKQIFPLDKTKIILHNKQYYICVSKLIEKYAKYIYYEKVNKKNKFIKDFYSNVDDFKEYDKTIVLTGNTDPRSSFIDINQKYKLYEVIPETRGEDPIIYKSENIFYLLQYTQMESINYALNICDEWIRTKRNIGYRTEKITKTLYPTVVYEIVDGALTPVSIVNADVGSDNKDFYEVLMYGKDKKNFASLLRIQE